MNIMVPPNAHNLPVMVYFHGGNVRELNQVCIFRCLDHSHYLYEQLVGGSAPSEISNAAAIAVLGKMVTVTVAYRLNVLGWLATDDLAQEQGGYAGNYGTQDAIMALQWINQNIAAFGGDPNHVVLTGQSSGGTLIFSLMAAPAAQGLFTAAYSMSGSPNMTQDASAKFAFDSTIVASVGCGNSSWTSAQRMACLRDLPASTLSKATPGPWGTPGIFGWYMPQGLPSPSVGGDNYAGIVYVDGNTVVLPFDQALIAGVNGNATLVISNMAAESDRGPGVNTLHLKGVGEWQSAVRDALAKWGPDANSTADTLSSMYLTEAKIEAQLAYDTMISDYGLVRYFLFFNEFLDHLDNDVCCFRRVLATRSPCECSNPTSALHRCI
jgi:carboxylesterase type B